MTQRLAKDETEYRNAWEHHIDELAMLALRARVDYSEYVQVKAQLNTWLNNAINHTRQSHE